MRSIAFLALVVSSTATVAQQTVTTPTGLPDATFENISLSDAAGKIAGQCMDRGWQVVNQTTNQVTCQIPFGGFKQVLAGALLGNAYSTPPNIYAAFSIAQIGENVRAQARAWMETQMAFGQVRQMQYTDAKTKTNLVAFLAAAGAQLPNGTIINGVLLGIDPQPGSGNQIAVSRVYEHTAAQDAGMKAGDVITGLNGKSFENWGEFAKRLNRVKDPTYTLAITRTGQPLTLTVERRSPPVVGSAEYLTLVREKQAKTADLSTLASAPTPAPSEPAQVAMQPQDSPQQTAPLAQTAAPQTIKAKPKTVTRPAVTCVTCK